MKAYLLVAIGGMIGSIGRYSVSTYLQQAFYVSKFPLGTLIVNLIGSLLIGIIAGLLTKQALFNEEIKYLLMTGFLGGFTTFSAFSMESLELLRSGMPGLALCYIFCSVALGITFVYLGMKLTL